MTELLVLRTHLDASQTLRHEGDVYTEDNTGYVKIREKLGIVTTNTPKPAPAPAAKPAAKPDAKVVADAPAAPTPFD